MSRAQDAITRSGDLMGKFHDLDYRLHCVTGHAGKLLFFKLLHAKWIPRVRDYGIWPDFTTIWERGVKRQISTLEDYPGIFSHRVQAELGTKRHVRLAQRRLVTRPLQLDAGAFDSTGDSSIHLRPGVIEGSVVSRDDCDMSTDGLWAPENTLVDNTVVFPDPVPVVARTPSKSVPENTAAEDSLDMSSVSMELPDVTGQIPLTSTAKDDSLALLLQQANNEISASLQVSFFYCFSSSAFNNLLSGWGT